MASRLVSVYFKVHGVGVWQHPCPENLKFLPARQLSQLLEVCVGDTVDSFIKAYLPLRFQGYAKEALGYSVSASTFKKKRRQAAIFSDAILPNVFSGATRSMALSGARPMTRAIGGRTKPRIGFSIIIPTPSYINQQTSQVTNKTLRTIAPKEAERMAKQFFELIEAAASRVLVEMSVDRKGNPLNRASSSSSDIAKFGRTSRATVILQRKASM